MYNVQCMGGGAGGADGAIVDFMLANGIADNTSYSPFYKEYQNNLVATPSKSKLRTARLRIWCSIIMHSWTAIK